MANENRGVGPRDPAFDEIALLVAQGLSNPLSADQAAKLDRLIEQVPDGRAFADALLDQWILAGIAGDPRQKGAQAPIVADDAAPEPAVALAGPIPAQRRMPLAALAAALLALVAAGLFFTLQRTHAPEPQLVAATDRPLTTTLQDGSKISLSRDGKLLVRLVHDRRDLQQIGGEAYYEVAKDHKRPFTVTASGYRLTALGTRFNVLPDPSGLRIDLLEGKLRIEAGQSAVAPVFLVAGQRFVGGAHPRVEPADPTAADWRSGRLVFNDVPLSEVARRLSRYSGRRVGIRSTTVGAQRFSGVLRWDMPDDWSAAFEATLPVAVEPAPDGIEIIDRPA